MRINKKLLNSLLTLIVIIALYISRSTIFQPNQNHNNSNKDVNNQNSLTAHFIDVGQGDSCFVELPNGKTMLIDCGEAKYSNDVSTYISDLGYETIDYVIATHGDSDHIGGFYQIFNDFNIESCYTSFLESDTKTYDKFCNAVDDENIELQTPFSNDYIIDTDYLDVKVLGPNKNLKYKDTNDASIVLLLSYYEFDFLFTGDATYQMLEEYNIGDIELLKASHHGSRTGISKELVNEILPEYTVISAGINNRYNHPHQETLDLLKQSEIYCTNQVGTIVAVCNDNSLNFNLKTDYQN